MAEARQNAQGSELRRQAPQSGLSTLMPVARQTVQDQVYSTLRRSLVHGLFDAGEVLRIRDIAHRMSTSTMPVREALARLISENALEALPNRSVRVPVISAERLEDLAAARALIEGELTRLAVGRLNEGDIAALRSDTESYDALADGIDAARDAADLNHAFHFRIYHAAGSSVLIPVVESLWMQSAPYSRQAAALFADTAVPATHYHHRLIAAIEARDANAAVAALLADISRSFDLLRHEFATAPGDR